jgi:tetratricopeptide (TPR) repeat protein
VKGLAESMLQLKKYDESVSLFSKVLARSPKHDSALAGTGWAYFFQEDYDKAQLFLLQALEMKPDSFLYLYRLGCVAWAKNQTDQAITYLLRAAKSNPHFSPCFSKLGDYYVSVEQDQIRATKCYQRAILLDPSNAEATKALVEIYIQNEKQTEADALLKNYCVANPRNAWAHKLLGLAFYVSFFSILMCRIQKTTEKP